MAGKLKEEVTWMAKPAPQTKVEGLEYLQDLDRVWVLQDKKYMEDVKNWIALLHFRVQTDAGERICWAQEESSKTGRWLTGSSREFTIHCTDQNDEEIMTFHRPFKTRAMLFSWTNRESVGWELECMAQGGKPVGLVKQVTESLMHRTFDLLDKDGNVQLFLRGPLKEIQVIKEDIEFKLFLPDRQTQVGAITRKFSGWGKEILTDQTHFLLTFPGDLDPTVKSLVIGATFLIEFMCFDNNDR